MMNTHPYHTLFVVDDNPAVLTALRICLDGVFERIVTLPVPENLLAMLRQERVDVVLLDMNFSLGVNSGRDGLFWMQAIHRRHPNLPVVLLTAYADVQLAVKGLKAGAVDFVTKPWDNENLIRVLKDAIDNSRAVVPLDRVEAEHIQNVVDRCNGNISRAAQLLGITRQTLYAKLRKS